MRFQCAICGHHFKHQLPALDLGIPKTLPALKTEAASALARSHPTLTSPLPNVLVSVCTRRSDKTRTGIDKECFVSITENLISYQPNEGGCVHYFFRRRSNLIRAVSRTGPCSHPFSSPPRSLFLLCPYHFLRKRDFSKSRACRVDPRPFLWREL